QPPAGAGTRLERSGHPRQRDGYRLRRTRPARAPRGAPPGRSGGGKLGSPDVTAGRPRATVLYNRPVLPADHPDAESESDVVGVAEVVVACLAGHGFDATPLAAGPPIAGLLQELDRRSPDVVFNLIEGFGGASAAATHVTGLLELAGLAFTGSPAEAL